MPYPLNNTATSNNYTDAATFNSPPTNSAFVQVYTAAVYYRITTLKDGVTETQYPERFLGPGKGTFGAGVDWRDGEALTKLEFRSAATGAPARVNAS